MLAPRQLCIALNKTLRLTQHRIRTIHGILPRVITSPTDESWSGIGQGSGASCPSWIAIESILLKGMKQLVPDTTICDPSGTKKFQMQAIGYVDDNNFIYIHNQMDKIDEKQSKMNQVFNAWSGLLGASGGKLKFKNVQYIIGHGDIKMGN